MQRFPLTAIQVQAPIVFAIGMMLGAAWYFLIDFEPNAYGIFFAAGLTALGVFAARLRGASAALVALSWGLTGLAFGGLSGSLATQRVAHATVPSEIGPVFVGGLGSTRFARTTRRAAPA